MSSISDRLPVSIKRPVSVVVFAISALLAIPLFVWLGASPALAAERGPGYGLTAALKFADANAYCVQLSRPSPVGKETRELRAGEPLPEPLSGMTEDDRARLHWAVATTGASTDPRDTAAVALYAWHLAEPRVFTNYGADTGALMNAIPANEVEQVRSRFRQLQADGSKVRAARISGSVTVQLRRIDGELQLRVSQPPRHSEVRVELVGAEFTDGARQRSFATATTVTLQQLSAEPTIATPLHTSATDGTHSGIVARAQGERTVTASYQLQYAPGYWSPDVRPLVTEDAQLIVAAADEFPKQRIGVTKESAPTATPTPTPVPTPTPTPSPTVTPTPTAPAGDEGDGTATPEPPATETEATAPPEPEDSTPETTPSESVPDESTPDENTPDENTPDENTLAPDPVETDSPSESPQPPVTTEPTAPRTSNPAPVSTSPAQTATDQPEAQHTSTPSGRSEQQAGKPSANLPQSQLPETGASFDSSTIMLPLGLAIALIALGGYALTRNRAAGTDTDNGW